MRSKENFQKNELQSTDSKQKESSEGEYHKISSKNIQLICYGVKQALDAVDIGTISKLLITEETLMKQNSERKKNLHGKYRGANIIVYSKGDKFWSELTALGGAVGMYRYDISGCSTAGP